MLQVQFYYRGEKNAKPKQTKRKEDTTIEVSS